MPHSSRGVVWLSPRVSVAVWLLVACLGFGFFSCAAESPQLDTIKSKQSALETSVSATLDTMIQQGSPGVASGTAQQIGVDGDESGTGDDVDALLRWDVSSIPQGNTVTAVKLELNVSNSGGSSVFTVHEAKRPWTNDATWTNYASGLAWQSAGALGANDAGTTVLGTLAGSGVGVKQYALNTAAVNLVQGWVDGTIANHGIIIRGEPNTDGMDFYTREQGLSYAAKLIVTYGAGGPVGGCSGNSICDNGETCTTCSAECGQCFVAAGDIAIGSTAQPLVPKPETYQTAALLDEITAGNTTGLIATLGDTAYHVGIQDWPTTTAALQSLYQPTWGAYKSRTYPVPGNHEYVISNATPYFDYFGTSGNTTTKPGAPNQGWYTYQYAGWQIYALNSECDDVGGCTATGAQLTWLRNHLNSLNPKPSCILAYTHHPLFASGEHADDADLVTRVKPIWQELYLHQADLLLSGHEHGYERFDRRDANGLVDADGIRQFVVGTGGAEPRDFDTCDDTPGDTSDDGNPYNCSPGVRQFSVGAYGVLRLSLKPGSYSWAFKRADDGMILDQGTETCHNAPTTSENSVETGYQLDPNPDLQNADRGVYYRFPDGFGGNPGDDPAYTLNQHMLYLRNQCATDLYWAGRTATTCANHAVLPCTSQVLKTWAETAIDLRDTGRKVIFRPRYDSEASEAGCNGSCAGEPNPCGKVEGDSLARMQNHARAIAKMLADPEIEPIVAHVEMGYLGSWGEWNTYGDNMNANNNLCTSTSPKNWQECQPYAPVLLGTTLGQDRISFAKYVVDRYQEEGFTKTVGLRAPDFYNDLVNSQGVPASWLGFYNDCWMRNASDGGTWTSFENNYSPNFPELYPGSNSYFLNGMPTDAKGYLQGMAPNGMSGGESCPADDETLSDWYRYRDTVVARLDADSMHYIHGAYADLFRERMTGAVGGGSDIWPEIRSRLGYRFRVTQVSYPQTATTSAPITVKVTINNDGFARIPYDRTAYLVLDGTTTDYVVGTTNPRPGAYTLIVPTAQAKQSVRSWEEDQNTTFEQSFVTPASGDTFTLHLYIPDFDCVGNTTCDTVVDCANQTGCTTPVRNNYALRLATKRTTTGTNLFEIAKGTNNLGVSIAVSGSCDPIANCQDRECGPDGCGGTCDPYDNTCPAGESCTTAGQCECTPICHGTSPCGPDSCGGSCGTCNSGSSCVNGECVCAPSCTGRVCGSDGCTGSCGSCSAGQTCNEATGQCAASTCAAGGNLIQNCDFSGGTTSWSCSVSGTAAATCSVVNGEYQTVITSPGASTYNVQPNQKPLSLTASTIYTMSFSAKASVARTIKVSVTKNHDDYASYSGVQTFNLTTTMATYSFDFTMNQADTNVKYEFQLGAAGNNTVTLDNVVLKPTASCQPQCSGRVCGWDGCPGNGVCAPNNCAAGTTCNLDGQCVCVPSCAGKACGDDGCGGECGDCLPPATCNGSNQCAGPAAAPGLSHHWKLDETSGSVAYDSGVTPYKDGTYAGTTSISTAQLGRGRAFDGVDDGLQIPTFAYGPSFSIGAWFKITDNSGAHKTLISHGTAYTPGSLYVRVAQEDGTIWTYFCDDNDPSCGTGFSFSGNYADGNWHHYMLTVDSTLDTTKIYVDGAWKMNVARGGNSLTWDTDLFIGKRGTSTPYYMKGGMDDVRIYDHDLTATEVATLYNNREPTDHIGHWKLDEGGTSTVAIDSYRVTPDSGTLYNGSTSGQQGPAWSGPGRVGAFALSFDGVDDSVRTGDSGYGPAFSVAMWFKITNNTAANGYHTLFSHGTPYSANSFFVRIPNAAQGSSAGRVYSYVRDTNPANDGDQSTGAAPPMNYADGLWHHYAITVGTCTSNCGGTNAKVYIDGRLVDSFDRGGEALNPAGEIWFGRRSDGSYPLLGLLDDVRLYNRVLTAADVANLWGM